MTYLAIKKELLKKADKKKALVLRGFFKTGKGEYGEGDKFLGVLVPEQRKIARQYVELNLEEVQKLLKSAWHEERMTALLIILYKFNKEKNENERKKVFDFYLKNTRYINNWDLVDVTCRDIVGGYLFDKNRAVLYKLVKSKNLWERRIAIVSTFYFIMRGEIKDVLSLSEILSADPHDLIHKATGWMLRETGKRCSRDVLISFLKKHYKKMPKVMFRYATEKLSTKEKDSIKQGWG